MVSGLTDLACGTLIYLNFNIESFECFENKHMKEWL